MYCWHHHHEEIDTKGKSPGKLSASAGSVKAGSGSVVACDDGDDETDLEAQFDAKFPLAKIFMGANLNKNLCHYRPKVQTLKDQGFQGRSDFLKFKIDTCDHAYAINLQKFNTVSQTPEFEGHVVFLNKMGAVYPAPLQLKFVNVAFADAMRSADNGSCMDIVFIPKRRQIQDEKQAKGGAEDDDGDEDLLALLEEELGQEAEPEEFDTAAAKLESVTLLRL